MASHYNHCHPPVTTCCHSCHHANTTTCCTQPQQQRQPTITDPLLVQAIISHLLHQRQQQRSPFTPLHSSHLKNHQQKQEEAIILSSLIRRIEALELSLKTLSSYSSSSASFSYYSLRDFAARVIQTHFRAYLVRRSTTLGALKGLAFIKSSFNALKSNYSHLGFEALFVKAMGLFLKLDSIQGGDRMIRDRKRSISRELVSFLDYLDEVVVQRHKELVFVRLMESRRSGRNKVNEDFESSFLGLCDDVGVKFMKKRRSGYKVNGVSGSGFRCLRDDLGVKVMKSTRSRNKVDGVLESGFRGLGGDQGGRMESLKDRVEGIGKIGKAVLDAEDDVVLEKFCYFSDDDNAKEEGAMIGNCKKNGVSGICNGVLVKRHGAQNKTGKSVSLADDENECRLYSMTQEPALLGADVYVDGSVSSDDSGDNMVSQSSGVEDIGDLPEKNRDIEEASIADRGSLHNSDKEGSSRTNARNDGRNYIIKGDKYVFSSPVPLKMEA